MRTLLAGLSFCVFAFGLPQQDGPVQQPELAMGMPPISQPGLSSAEARLWFENGSVKPKTFLRVERFQDSSRVTAVFFWEGHAFGRWAACAHWNRDSSVGYCMQVLGAREAASCVASLSSAGLWRLQHSVSSRAVVDDGMYMLVKRRDTRGVVTLRFHSPDRESSREARLATNLYAAAGSCARSAV